MMLAVGKEESSFLEPQIPFETGVDFACLAEVISDRFDADSEGKQIPVFGSSPYLSVLVHHFWTICLLVIFKNPIVVLRNQPGHYFVDLSALELALVVPEHLLASCVDLVHDSAVFSIKLQENNSVFLARMTLASRQHLLSFVGRQFDSPGFLQDLQTLLLVVEHPDQVPRIKVVAFYIFELFDRLPGFVYSYLQRKKNVCKVV